MSRIRPFVVAALLLAVLVPLVPRPAQAQMPVPSLTPVKLLMTVNVIGAGPTEAEAIDNALALARENYWVLGYSVVAVLCEEVDPPGPLEPFTFCSAELEVTVIRKAVLIRP